MVFKCDITVVYVKYVMKFHLSRNALGNILLTSKNKFRLVAVASIPFQLVY
jgi:hypothetical protein